MALEDLQLCPLVGCQSPGREAEGAGSSREPFLVEPMFKSEGALLRCKELAASAAEFCNKCSSEFAVKRLL